MSGKNNIEKQRFLIVNLIKGFFWFLAIILGFILVRKYGGVDWSSVLAPYLSNPWLVVVIYSLSEIFFGIIPPEIFFLWALEKGNPEVYAGYIVFFAVISYFAGFLAFLFGREFHKAKWFRAYRRYRLKKMTKLFGKYGGFLIVVAALTPVPFSGSCMLAGSAGYPVKKFLLYALFRFVRFFAYGLLLWLINPVN